MPLGISCRDADPSDRHRPGHHLDARDRVRRKARAGGSRAAGAAPDLPGAGMGRARSGGNLGQRGGDRARRHGQGRCRGKRHRRHRHHQPARDDDRLGPRHRQADPQRHRLAGPPHRGRLRRAARRRRRAGDRRKDRPAARSVFLRDQDRLAARPCRRRAGGGGAGRARVRHRRLVPDLAADRRQGSRHRRHQRLAHAAVRHPPRAMGSRALASCSTCRRRCCRRCATAPRISARREPALFGGADRHSRRRRRPAGRHRRPGLLCARHDEIDLWHRLLRPAQHRGGGGALAPPPAHHHRLSARRPAHLRAGRGDLHRRRRGAMAARRLAHHWAGFRSRCAGAKGRSGRAGLSGAGLRRSRRALLGRRGARRDLSA